MGTLVRLILITLVIVPFVAVLFNRVLWFAFVPPIPTLPETWWGSGSQIEDTSIYPFRITASQEILDDLKYRLKHVRHLTPALIGTQQQYGFNAATLRPILDYWANEYDWPTREEFLNQFPHFKTKIQGLNIHFIHVKPSVTPDIPIVPLLILHGWPGSVREFYKIIPILTQKHKRYGYAFEIIAPSLPGHAFSDGAIRPGLGGVEMSLVLKNLMLRLGHQKFYVQGGDFGSVIAQNMAILFPQHILGLHTNLPLPVSKLSFIKVGFVSIWPSFYIEGKYIFRMFPLSSRISDLIEESGYFHIQATKPDTIGVGINDSPAGLAAYVLEKFSSGTNLNNKLRLDGGLIPTFTYDELIDNLMFYWISQTATTAMRLSAESLSTRQYFQGLYDIPISKDVPCAVARYPNEIYYYPDWILRDKYTNLVYSSDLDEGGHFAAFEVPTIFAEDLFTAVDRMTLTDKQ